MCFQFFIFFVEAEDLHLKSVESHHLPPQHDLHTQDQSREEGEDDGCHETNKEGEEGPEGEEEEGAGDDDEVGDHPGYEEQVFVKHGTKDEEERDQEMYDKSGDDTKHNGTMVNIKDVKIRHSDVHNLKNDKIFQSISTNMSGWESGCDCGQCQTSYDNQSPTSLSFLFSLSHCLMLSLHHW